MSLDNIERTLYSDVVKLVNRTENILEFLFDGNLYSVKGGGNIFTPRHIALHAISKHPIRIDSSTGLVSESFFGVEGDDIFPSSMLGMSNKEIEEVVESDKAGDDTVFTNGKFVKKQRINLKPQRDNSLENNQ